MIALTSTVFNWYQQRKSPRLFAAALAKQRRVSIHDVVNANAGLNHYAGLNTHNTINLLRLRRKREPITRDYLLNIGNTHYIASTRIIKNWDKAKLRA